MSRDMRNSVPSSPSVRLRSTNWPIWLPIAPSISSSPWSGSRIVRLKNSSMPKTLSPSTIGKPMAPCSPSRAATLARGKLESCVTSAIHAGRALSQTRPGRPTPRRNTAPRVAASNSDTTIDARCQVSRQRIDVPARSTVHTAPWSQLRISPSTRRIRGAASASEADSASARAVTVCACSLRIASACSGVVIGCAVRPGAMLHPRPMPA